MDNSFNTHEWETITVNYSNYNSLLYELILSGVFKSIDRNDLILISDSERIDNFSIVLCNASQNNKEKIVTWLNNYFEKSPSLEKEYVLPLNTWFIPYPNNTLRFQNHDFKIIETGGLYSSREVQKLLIETSKTFVENIYSENKELDSDAAVEKILMLNMGFVIGSGIGREEAHQFYSWYLEDAVQRIKFIDGVEDIFFWKQCFLESLSQTFQNQGEDLGGFIEAIYTAIEEDTLQEEWLTDWIHACSSYSTSLQRIRSEGLLHVPFVDDDSLADTYNSVYKDLRRMFEYNLNHIFELYGIPFHLKWNIVFAIKETLKNKIESLY